MNTRLGDNYARVLFVELAMKPAVENHLAR